MKNQTPGDRFRAAFDEASMELQEILMEVEQLSLELEQVEKMVEVLKPNEAHVKNSGAQHVNLKGKRVGLTVLTHLAVVNTIPGVEN